MIDLINIRNAERWTHASDEDFYVLIRPFGGPITTHDQAEIYLRRCIVEAGGFRLGGKAIKRWTAKTGMAEYNNNQKAYIGPITWHDCLPPMLATELLAHLYDISNLTEDDAKNS